MDAPISFFSPNNFSDFYSFNSLNVSNNSNINISNNENNDSNNSNIIVDLNPNTNKIVNIDNNEINIRTPYNGIFITDMGGNSLFVVSVSAFLVGAFGGSIHASLFLTWDFISQKIVSIGTIFCFPFFFLFSFNCHLIVSCYPCRAI